MLQENARSEHCLVLPKANGAVSRFRAVLKRTKGLIRRRQNGVHKPHENSIEPRDSISHKEVIDIRDESTPAEVPRSLLDILYSDQVYAKIWGVAKKELTKSSPPTLYPEYTEPRGTQYVYRNLDFWTSGFFPGSLYLLLERERRYRSHSRDSFERRLKPHIAQLEFACKWWTTNLHQNASLATTHDLGFMIFPWASLAWELDHDAVAYDTIIRASRTLASRYNPAVGAIRSWDTSTTKQYSYQDPSEDFLVIIDNMANLDMLFWTAYQTNDSKMYDLAISHAHTTLKHHVRPDHSTAHLVIFDTHTGAVKAKHTHQGYSDTSAWARGQAWAIMGFAQTYHWTNDVEFLQAAMSCADYFLSRLPASRVSPWDFDAPPDPRTGKITPDTSAGMVAAYGMLLIHQAQLARGKTSRYFREALDLVAGISAVYLNPPSRFVALHNRAPVMTVEDGVATEGAVEVGVDDEGSPQTILGGSTINNYEFALRRWADHGLVYADYYFLLVGNKLLEMNAAEQIKDILVEKRA